MLLGFSISNAMQNAFGIAYTHHFIHLIAIRDVIQNLHFVLHFVNTSKMYKELLLLLLYI